MKYGPDIHHRRSIRLPVYDYAQAGAYFVTICVQEQQCLLGDVVAGEMRLNGVGKITQSVWNELPWRFPGITLDQYAIMPNHVHGIIVLVGAQFIAPHGGDTTNQGVMNHAPTLGEIVRTFKAVTTRRIRLSGLTSFGWQRNYYERIIRDDKELDLAREYMANNPLRWQIDQLHPDDPGTWLSGSTVNTRGRSHARV